MLNLSILGESTFFEQEGLLILLNDHCKGCTISGGNNPVSKAQWDISIGAFTYDVIFKRYLGRSSCIFMLCSKVSD